MGDGKKAVRVRVTGRVQGVSYRAWAADCARRLRLGGWVRNEDDGSVAALLAGDPGAVDEMVAALSKGPLLAGVQDVQTEPADPEPWPQEFEVRR